jgi:hypothetical protein
VLKVYVYIHVYYIYTQSLYIIIDVTVPGGNLPLLSYGVRMSPVDVCSAFPMSSRVGMRECQGLPPYTYESYVEVSSLFLLMMGGSVMGCGAEARQTGGGAQPVDTFNYTLCRRRQRRRDTLDIHLQKRRKKSPTPPPLFLSCVVAHFCPFSLCSHALETQRKKIRLDSGQRIGHGANEYCCLRVLSYC